MSSRRQRSTNNRQNSNNRASNVPACIDLTVDIGGDEVIDLTYAHNIMDSSVVILSPTDDVGPIRRRRGSGRRGLRRSSSRNRQHRRESTPSPSINMPSSSNAGLIDSDHSDNELPNLPFTIPSESSKANARFIQSPTLNISCPVCLDDLKQIKSNKKRIMSTICGHLFCEECITSAIRSLKSCPTCRKSLTLSKIHPIFL